MTRRLRDPRLWIILGIAALAVTLVATLSGDEPPQPHTPPESQAVKGTLTPFSSDVNQDLENCTDGDTALSSCGAAPPIDGISRWFNTPGGEPLEVGDLKGKVVLVDFWAYSCISCQRNQPYVNAWNEAYADAGLEIIGVQSAEFPFEKDPTNLQQAIDRAGITYPVALDPNTLTMANYRNRYWPAKYLIDAEGTVRYLKFGEGAYANTEKLIRELLTDAKPDVTLPPPVSQDVKAVTRNKGITQETYLSYSRAKNYAGSPQFSLDEPTDYTLNTQQPGETWSLGGTWLVGTQQSVATNASQIRLNAKAAKVYNVVSGEGTITVTEKGEPDRRIQVRGYPRNYQILGARKVEEHTFTLNYSKGLTVYTFSFG